jgi:uncharacterized repeat protein (TIGR01451 family)
MFERPSRLRRVFAISFGFTFAVIAIAAGAVFLGGSTAEAASYTLTSTAPVTNWSDVTKWNGGTGATYPGQSAGDTVTVSLNGFTLNIDVAIANPVQLNLSNSVPITIPSGSSLLLLSSSSATTSNTFSINGGTFGVAAGNSLTSWAGPITVNTGTFSLGAGATLQTASGSAFTFNGGTISGGGTLKIPAAHTASFTGSGGAMTLDNVIFDNSGTTTYNSASNALSLNNAAQIANESGATFNYSSSQPINTNSVGSPKINNLGTINISAGTSPAINVDTNNDGTIALLDASSPQTLKLFGGGTHTGAFTLAQTASTITFAGGTHNIQPGVTLTGGATGGFSLTGGTLSINTPFSVPVMSESGGTLSGTAAFTAGTLNWTGGTMSGSGTTTAVNTANINGGSATTLSGRQLITSGTTHYQPAVPLSINSGGVLTNNGTFNLENSSTISSDVLAAPSFTNNGTLAKAVGGTTTFGVPLSTSGTISLSGGSVLELTTGGTCNGGTISFGSAADTLQFYGSTFTVATAPTITGLGLLKVDMMSTFVVNANLTAPNVQLEQTGAVSGAQTLTVTSKMKWTGGNMIGGGTTVLTSSATGDFTALIGGVALTSHTLTNNGTINYNPTYSLELDGSGVLNNAGTFNILGNGSFTSVGGGNSFNNSGTVNKTAGAGTFTFGVPFANSGAGIVNSQVAGGTIAFGGNSSSMSGGTIEATSATSTIDFSGGTFTVTGGTLAGPGAVRVNGGTLTPNVALTLPSNFQMSSGQLSGTGTLTVPNAATFKWSGGTITGSGTIAIASGGDFTADSTSSSLIYNSRALSISNGGNFHWNAGSNSLIFQSTSQVTNSGTFTVATNGTIGNATGQTMTNNGTFIHTGGGTLNMTLGYATASGSTTTEQGGTLAFLSSAGVIHQGTFDAQTGSTISFAAGNQDCLAPFGFSAGSGTYKVTGATFVLNGANVSAPNFELVSGNLTGSGNLTTTNTFTWDGGTMDGAGTTTVASGTASLVTGPLSLGRNLTLSGNSNFSAAGGMSVTGAVAITNNAAFTYSAGADVTASGGPTFTNNGTFSRTTTAATTNFGPAFTNAGTASFHNGITNLQNGFTQTAPGTLNVAINGTTAGTQYDRLAVTGNVSLNGTLNATLGYTPVAGSTFDVVTFTGTRTGDFATKNLPTFAGSGVTQASYVAGSPNALRITAVATQTDVSITQSTPASVAHGQNATITFTVANGGPDTATGVAATLNFSGGNLSSVTPSTGSCSGTGPINCSIGTLTNGAHATITLVLNANAVGTITTSGTNTSTTFDPNSANDSTGSGSINVVPAADFGVSVTDSPDPVIATGLVFYTIGITNSGPDGASPTIHVSVTNGTISSAPGCSVTGATTATCSLGTIGSGVSTSIQLAVTAPSQPGSMSLAATVSSSTTDLNSANDTASQSTTVTALSDLAITKTLVGALGAGSNATYTITVQNLGPSDATGISVADATPAGLTFVSNTGACTTPFPCGIGLLTSGSTATITSTYAVAANASGSVTNTATVTAATADPNAANNSSGATATIGVSADLSIVKHAPATANAGGSTTYQLDVANAGPSDAANVVVTDPTPSGLILVTVSGGCSSFPCNLGTMASGQSKTLTAVYNIVPNLSGIVNNTASVSSSTPDANPNNNSSHAFTTLSQPIPPFPCPPLATPAPAVVASTLSGQSYDVQWPAVDGATGYQIDEATDANFTTPSTQAVSTTVVSFTHNTQSSTQTFYYRVRALSSACPFQFSADSQTVQVIIAPLPPPNTNQHSVNVPAGSKQVVIEQVFIPGLPGGNYAFNATADQSWITVSPSSGILTPNGLALQVKADPSDLPNGTFTGTIIVTLTAVGGSNVTHTSAATVVSVPISVNLVTPVALGQRATPPANALVIPSVGHLDGLDSHWQSDIRVSNTGVARQSYALAFTPADTTKAVQSTTISIDPGATTALDDIVANWYGATGSGGTLELHPIDSAGRVSPVTTTVASSRTYNVTTGGTLGQFIPAIPFAQFAGSANGILSLQQVAQSAAYRTNFGIVEGSGQPAAGTMSIFDAAGAKLKDVPFSLAPFEQQSFNGMIAANGIASLPDGRVSVQVLSGGGKVTTFASVVDNHTGDPLLVSGIPLGAIGSTRYVLPGVADINNGFANWRTDMRVFNASASPQLATLTFMPIGGGASTAVDTVINAGEEKALDNVVASVFGGTNVGGSVHVTTSTPSSLVVTARTYNQTDNGTYGQFIGAVTAADAVGLGDRTLQVLQVEDSPRYRTNVGVAEVTGQPATVEVSIILPDSRVTPKITLNLDAYQYIQFAPIRDAGLGNAYNARIAVRVTGGTGKITAYGSVIDQQTQDPTYVPAQ